jgi:hypothetical protein
MGERRARASLLLARAPPAALSFWTQRAASHLPRAGPITLPSSHESGKLVIDIGAARNSRNRAHTMKHRARLLWSEMSASVDLMTPARP